MPPRMAQLPRMAAPWLSFPEAFGPLCTAPPPPPSQSFRLGPASLALVIKDSSLLARYSLDPSPCLTLLAALDAWAMLSSY